MKTRNVVQLVWGFALALAGIGVFFRIPHVMPKVARIEQFADVMVYIRISFYLLGFLLVSGGGKKVFDYYRKNEDGNGESGPDSF